MSKMMKQTILIEGMHCSACAMNIDFDLEDVDGITSVKTSYAKQECEVEYDAEKTNLNVVLEQIKKTGYTATPKEKK